MKEAKLTNLADWLILSWSLSRIPWHEATRGNATPTGLDATLSQVTLHPSARLP